MGLTKQYLRYKPAGIFGLVGSSKSQVLLLNNDSKSNICAVGACENVFVWDIKRECQIKTLSGDKHEVTKLATNLTYRQIAVGYTDGTVNIFDLNTSECIVNFSGHKSSVTALNYDKEGSCLVSGAKDTALIVWDTINESGLYRLRGHKGVITQARFMDGHNILVSCSKDTFVKFWDLNTQHCFRTLVGHRTEVWDFVLARDDQLLISGSADNELRVWGITFLSKENEIISTKKSKLENGTNGHLLEDNVDSDLEEDNENDEGILTCEKLGSIIRQGKDRVYTLSTDATGKILACHGNDALIEVFKINTEEEAEKRLKKKQKKVTKRAKDKNMEIEEILKSVDQDLQRLISFKMSSKLRSFDCYIGKSGLVKIAGLLLNNTLEIYSFDVNEKKATAVLNKKISQSTHFTDVRTLTFSSDSTAIMSGSSDSIKVWNRNTLQCIRTISCKDVLSSIFAPGDRHVIVGTKSGKILIMDLAANLILETIDAHQGAVWSLCLSPDKKCVLSGSADKDIKFWDFELTTDEDSTSKRLTLTHTRTLKMSEDVLCVKISPDYKFLAAALLDNTVKVFFVDTLKFFLSLYGHKLPVLTLDISSDSTLLVSGSADRNVKIWGLDFGDCHKSIFAHDDSVMNVAFIPKTHMFHSVGKDHKLKQWDADTFEHITTLEGHHAEIWSLAINPSGNFVVTASHDKSMRVWEKSEEVLVLEHEREVQRELEQDKEMSKDGTTVIPGETNTETGIAGRKTNETVKAADKLIEALELYFEEQAKIDQYNEESKVSKKQLPEPARHILLHAFKVSTPDKYVLEVLKKVKSSELEESLLVLPFKQVIDLLKLLNGFIMNEWDVELSCRCLLFLLRIHHGQITSNHILLPILNNLRASAIKAVHNLKDTIGFNMAGLQFLQNKLQQNEEVTFFTDATDQYRKKRKREKKKAVLTLQT